MDDPLRNRQNPAPLELQSSFFTAIYDGPLLDAADLFGRPGGHPFGIGALSPFAQVPVFTNAPPPEPQVYEREVKGELQRAKDRVTQAAPQVQARVHADIERREVFTGPLIDFSPVGRIATRLVVIDGLVEETGQQLAWWQPRSAILCTRYLANHRAGFHRSRTSSWAASSRCGRAASCRPMAANTGCGRTDPAAADARRCAE